MGCGWVGDWRQRRFAAAPGASCSSVLFGGRETRGLAASSRRREYSWYSTRGTGFRIDHAFLSPLLAARAGSIRYSDEERLAGLSDHSSLILDLDP